MISTNITAFRLDVVAIIVLPLFSMLVLPRFIRQHGYALPGKGGTPCTIPYAHRGYVGPLECKRDFMYGQTLTCNSETDLIKKGWWPLVRVGSIPTLLGAPRPVLVEKQQDSVATPTAVFMQVEANCYVPYSLLGGP